MRVVAIARAGYGAALVGMPGPLIARASGMPADGRDRVTARVLGVRHLLQAATTMRAGPDALSVGAIVDATHAASMVALGVCDRSRRRVALFDATVEVGFATVGMMLSGRLRRSANHPT